MINFDPLALTKALSAGADTLRATAEAQATLIKYDSGPL
ncbi:MAG: hypothetical protein RLZZ437_175 [Pseudomonadota bacterium]